MLEEDDDVLKMVRERRELIRKVRGGQLRFFVYVFDEKGRN